MTPEEMKAGYRRMIEEVFNQGRLELVDELVAADAVDHTEMPGRPPGAEGVRWAAQTFRAAFPDIHFQIEDQVAQGELLATRFSISGTQNGEFMGVPPSGKRAAIAGMDMVRLRDGKMVEHWALMDMLSLMQQLGLMPAAAAE
jgi:steroid delta-isomerase-like uncharacterized protein